MKRRKLRRNIHKLAMMLDKNKKLIKRIVLSENMVDKLHSEPDLINIGITKDKEGAETWFLFGIESVVSAYILQNCILEMENGEIVKIEGFSDE